MKLMKLWATILGLLFISLTGGAQVVTGGVVTEMELLGRSFEGPFTVRVPSLFGVRLLTGRIQIQFLDSLSGNGELLYFHHITSGGLPSDILGEVDSACPHTPRALLLNSEDSVTTNEAAEISAYPCASTQEEKQLEQQALREPKIRVRAKTLELLPGDFSNGAPSELKITCRSRDLI